MEILLALVPPLLILAGLLVRFAVRLVYGPRGPAVGDWAHRCVMGASWALIGFGLAPVALALGASVLGVFFVLMGMATLVEVVAGGRAAQRRVNAALLAELAERPSDLEAGAALAAALPPGRVGDSTRDLFDMIRRGAPVSDALSVSRGAAPAEACTALAVGRAVGDPPGALKLLTHTGSASLNAVYRNSAERSFYLASIGLVILSVLTFVMVWIVPEYAKILDEFDMPPPLVTRTLLSTTGVSVTLFSLIFATLAFFLGLAAPVVAICYLCDVPVLRPLTDRFGWDLRVAEVHRYLGLAARRGAEFGGVLEQIALEHPSRLLRRRVERASQRLAVGEDWTDALCDSRLLARPEQALVRAGAEAGNLPWVFKTLALRRERRLGYRASAAVQVLFPAAIFLLGAAVGFIVVALFLPLLEMIHGLA